jgi:hypothetical protein
VAKNAHAFVFGSALDLEHLSALKPHKARMSKIERNGKTWHAVGREPFLGNPYVRPKAEAPYLHFGIETLDPVLERRSPDSDRQIAKPQIEKFFFSHLA